MATEKFQWTDELVKEYIDSMCTFNLEHPYQIKKFEDFKKSKEVPIPEYEITAFRIPAHGNMIVNMVDGYSYPGNKIPVEKYLTGLNSLEDGWCEIYSVKRLSDGEIFTLGDVIELFGDYPTGSIDKFVIDYFNKTRISAYNNCGFGKGIVACKKVPVPDYEITEYGYAQTIDDLPDHQYISKVKRLSDGVTFSIGDTCESNSVKGYTYKPIKRFFIKDGLMYIQFNEGHGSNDGCLTINSVKKVEPKEKLFTTTDMVDIYFGDPYFAFNPKTRNKWSTQAKEKTQPNKGVFYFSTEAKRDEYIKSTFLFKTEDGVDIFQGDKVIFMRNDFSAKWCTLRKEDNAPFHYYKYFSSEEKANEYILQNKPVPVSLNEILDNIPEAKGKDFEAIDNIICHLKDFFKTKTLNS